MKEWAKTHKNVTCNLDCRTKHFPKVATSSIVFFGRGRWSSHHGSLSLLHCSVFSLVFSSRHPRSPRMARPARVPHHQLCSCLVAISEWALPPLLGPCRSPPSLPHSLSVSSLIQSCHWLSLQIQGPRQVEDPSPRWALASLSLSLSPPPLSLSTHTQSSRSPIQGFWSTVMTTYPD